MSCFTDFYKDGVSASEALQNAIADAVKGDRKLFFPPGEYHFYPEYCPQRYCLFSNNDEGVKTIAMLLDSVDDFTISGAGAMLIFHGRISPLCAFNCRNLTVEGITVDFEDSFVSDADLVRRENGIAWFKFHGKHKVVGGKIIFTGDFYDNLHGCLPFQTYDRKKGELTLYPETIYVANSDVLYKDGLIGLPDRFSVAGTEAFVVKHELRLCPGMVFDNCCDITISQVTLHHAAGMGFLIQNSENCCVEACRVIPRGRRTSVSDDALHITDCRGKIRVADCIFTGTLDDSINIHGVYRKLKSRIPGGKMYYLEAGHYQQQGVFNVKSGDHLELRRRETGEAYAVLKLTGITPVNKGFVIVDFDEKELPSDFTEGDPGWIFETRAEVEVVNTVCMPLNGRGILASGMKKIRISGCHLHTAHAGIFISGDFSFWYESGPVAETVIENNFFDNCNNINIGATREPLAVFPELRQLKEGFFYHGSMVVRNNRFLAAERPLISMMSVAEAVVENNRFESDDSYEFNHKSRDGYFFTDRNSPKAAFLHCGKVVLQNNPGFDC